MSPERVTVPEAELLRGLASKLRIAKPDARTSGALGRGPGPAGGHGAAVEPGCPTAAPGGGSTGPEPVRSRSRSRRPDRRSGFFRELPFSAQHLRKNPGSPQ